MSAVEHVSAVAGYLLIMALTFAIKNLNGA